MSMTIGVAGKGGTGKTTIAALLTTFLKTKGTVLAVDADPSTNLNMALGLPEPETVGTIREELLKANGGTIDGMSRHEFIELRARQAMVESEGLDLLAMGRPEGAGCYCPAHYVLKVFLDRLMSCTLLDPQACHASLLDVKPQGIHPYLGCRGNIRTRCCWSRNRAWRCYRGWAGRRYYRLWTGWRRAEGGVRGRRRNLGDTRGSCRWFWRRCQDSILAKTAY